MFNLRSLMSWFFVVMWCLCPASASASNPTPAERVIGDLYRNLGCLGPSVSASKCDMPEADHRKAVIEQSRAVLEKYFDASLVALLMRERQCMVKTKEICNLDFDPLYASQDPDAADFKIKATAASKVTVSFRYPSNGERITIQYLMVPTRSGPRITDVIYSDNTSLRKLLTTKLP